jgi:hypothetical protein
MAGTPKDAKHKKNNIFCKLAKTAHDLQLSGLGEAFKNRGIAKLSKWIVRRKVENQKSLLHISFAFCA